MAMSDNGPGIPPAVLEDRAARLREVLAQLDAGEVTAGAAARAHVAGSLAALEGLLEETRTGNVR